MATLDPAGIQSSTFSNDQLKFLAQQLLRRNRLRLVARSLCDKVQQPTGTGKTGNFIRYLRMNLPTAPITEGNDPPFNNFSYQLVTSTLDQWADVVVITDVAQLTIKHPIMQTVMDLLADNAQRVIDREVQLVWLANTNVQYGDSTVTARRSITGGMKMSDTIIHRAVTTMSDLGVPARNGPSTDEPDLPDANSDSGSIRRGQAYVAVANTKVVHDIMAAGTSLGTWAAVAMYANQEALYNAEVGTWLGVRWVETNFIPKFQLLGNSTEAVTSTNAFGTDTPVVTDVASGGSLNASATYAFAVTRKDLQRGFEEFISIPHTIATSSSGGNAHSITFNFSSLTAGYVYNLYFDTVQAGTGAAPPLTSMNLVSDNIAVGTTVTVTAIASGGITPPDYVASGLVVHPVYIHGLESCNWVGLQDLEVMISPDEATFSNPAKLRRTVAYKFMAKTMVRDTTRILRVEVVSTY